MSLLLALGALLLAVPFAAIFWWLAEGVGLRAASIGAVVILGMSACLVGGAALVAAGAR